MISKRLGPTRLLVVVASAMLVAAACSGSATTAPASAAPASAAAASAAAASAAAASAAPASAPAAAANSVYTPLAAPPCDLSQKDIYFLSVLKGHPTLRLWQQGFLDEAARMGFKNVTIASPDDADWAKAVALGEQILATETPGNYGVVFGYGDPSEAAIIKKFGDAKVPVIFTHQALTPNQYPGVLAWSGFVPEKWGTSAADAIGAKINGTGAVAITEGSFNATEDAVAKAFTTEMNAKYPNVKVLKPQEEGFDPPTAIAKAVAILQANPDVVGALSTTGAGPVTWGGAADQSGRTVYSIGPDMTRPNMDLVKAGKVFALAAQPGYEEHQQAVDMIAKSMCGQSVSYANELQTAIVQTDALAPYYDVVNKEKPYTPASPAPSPSPS
jgi:ribose transport system substrate-binding protein